MKRVLLVALGIGLIITACSDTTPPQDDNPPVLGGLDALPKQIATLALTDTPTPVISGGDTVNVSMPTATPAPPRPTATLTPYVGVFLGAPTSDGSTSDNPEPTPAPYVINPVSGGPVISSGNAQTSSGACAFPVAEPLSGAYNTNPTAQQRLGCPVNGSLSTLMVIQPFEQGNMFWRDTKQIYALAQNGQVWQVADTWEESMPADDPGLVPPGGLLQPVRGFGLVWRSNQAIRDALGWGVQLESPYTSTWQDFERGAMFTGPDGHIYALYLTEGQHSGPL